MNNDCNRSSTAALFALTCVIFMTGCAGLKTPGQPEPVPEIRPGLLQGYLPAEELPNSPSLLPPAPVIGSVAYELDLKISQSSLTLRGTPRWDLAITDAELKLPQLTGAFSCALNAPISEKDTPQLYMLLRRSFTDAGIATLAAKNYYNRTRPFQANQKPTCTPDFEPELEKNGSYPSGHAAIGWTWALILSELAPERIDTILARGRAFGQNRVVCNVHWQSDVIEGRSVGAAVYARLQSDSEFAAAIASVKSELAAVQKKACYHNATVRLK